MNYGSYFYNWNKTVYAQCPIRECGTPCPTRLNTKQFVFRTHRIATEQHGHNIEFVRTRRTRRIRVEHARALACTSLTKNVIA